LGYIKNLLKFLKVNAGAEFSEMVVDFIKDEAGTWWLINVKSFIMKLQVPHTLRDIYKEEKSDEFKRKKDKKFNIVGH